MHLCVAGSLKGVGIPVKLIHEAEGHIVTVREMISSILGIGRVMQCDEVASTDLWS